MAYGSWLVVVCFGITCYAIFERLFCLFGISEYFIMSGYCTINHVLQFLNDGLFKNDDVT